MFDLGWSELLVIGIVALIVVGPKDLPIMFRKLGQFTGRARAMAREFTSAMDKAADDAGVKDIQRDLRAMTNPKKMGLDAINKAAEGLDGWGEDDVAPNTPATTPPVSPARAKPTTPTAAAPAVSPTATAASGAPDTSPPLRPAAAATATDDTPA